MLLAVCTGQGLSLQERNEQAGTFAASLRAGLGRLFLYSLGGCLRDAVVCVWPLIQECRRDAVRSLCRCLGKVYVCRGSRTASASVLAPPGLTVACLVSHGSLLSDAGLDRSAGGSVCLNWTHGSHCLCCCGAGSGGSPV